MTTKENCLSFKDKQESSVIDTSTGPYSNINLNRNHHCLIVETVHSNKFSNKKVQNHDLSHDTQKSKSSLSWKKSENTFPSEYLNIHLNSDRNKSKEGKDHSSKNKNASTLSLHIAAYENFIETESEKVSESLSKLSMVESKDRQISKKVLIIPFNDNFEFPRSNTSDEDTTEPEVMQFSASQKLLTPKTSQRRPILKAGAKHLGSQSSYLNFAKRGRFGISPSAGPSTRPSSSSSTAMERFDDFDVDDAERDPTGDSNSLRCDPDDLCFLNRSHLVEFTTLDQQLILLHNRLRSSAGQNDFFETQWTFELVTGAQLPYSSSIDDKLIRDLKKLWGLTSKFFCSSCSMSLKFESSKCTNELCHSKNKRNIVICSADVRQQLLHIVKKFGDFSSLEDGDERCFKLTVNTDGAVPKGHGQVEVWPVYLQPADFPLHVKATPGSVALQSLIYDNGKPSDFAWEAALSDLVAWLHDQGDGLKLQITSSKIIKVFFEIHNLSADLAASCHLFHFASWASSSEACMLCKVKPIRAHNAQRWQIVDENLIRRNNLNITLDMLRKQGGFKQGATFWMQLVNVLQYRFDNLHKLCEGVCSTLLKELFGASKKMGSILRMKNLAVFENTVKSIEWPTKTKITFSKLNSGTAYEKLGCFLVAVPLALSTSDIPFEFILWLLGVLGIIYSEFSESSSSVNKRNLLQKLAQLQFELCGTVFSTLKFHYFFVHLYEKMELTDKTSTFVFEMMNRYIKMKMAPNHQKAFNAAILDTFLLERTVKYELERRSEHCPEVKSYLEKVNWKNHLKKGVEVGEVILKGEVRNLEDKHYFDRALLHGKLYSRANYNPINANVTFHQNNQRLFGKILDIYKCGDAVEVRIEVYNLSSIKNFFDPALNVENPAVIELAHALKDEVFQLLDEHIKYEENNENLNIITTNIQNVLGHCLIVPFNGKKFFFDLAFKAECK